MYKLLVKQGIVEHLLSPNVLASIRNDILLSGASRGQKFNITNMRQMQLEANTLDKVPPFNINKIANFTKRRLAPPHMTLEKKEMLKVASLSKALYITKLELKNFQIR